MTEDGTVPNTTGKPDAASVTMTVTFDNLSKKTTKRFGIADPNGPTTTATSTIRRGRSPMTKFVTAMIDGLTINACAWTFDIPEGDITSGRFEVTVRVTVGKRSESFTSSFRSDSGLAGPGRQVIRANAGTATDWVESLEATAKRTTADRQRLQSPQFAAVDTRPAWRRILGIPG